ncbi:MAG: FapA family protein [Sulfurimonas sp.]|nr:FapA family protein [Sulfurimonas sp.]
MALFGLGKKDTILTLKKVRPTVVRTQNVAKELLSVASSYDVKVDTLDFNIFEVQTYIRMYDGSKESEWNEIANDALRALDDETQLLHPHFQIKQTYEIEIFTIDSDPYEKFKIAVGANATKCKIYLSIVAGSEISYSSRLEADLLGLINKKKIRAGILINIFDEMLSDTISKINAYVKLEENAKYDKNETYLIAESYEPTLTTDDALLLYYDKTEKVDEKKKVDYSSRGFIKSVTQDEVLIEYIKARAGKPGRNCRGEFMKPKEPETKYEPTFAVDETIKVIETELSIEYIATENGYISFEDNKYLIKTEVDVSQISFKTTGSIASGLHSDVSIVVKETDAIKDAIGMGMNVEVSEIDIDGNVGSNATVHALRAKIGGQTHKTATLRAEKLDINVHKGSAYGKQIHITRLEHGTVDGDTIEVTQALGGHIRGKEVTIELCGSYVHATASKFIEIIKMQGSENVFIIDPLLKKDLKEGLDSNQEQIKSFEIDLRNLKKEILGYETFIKDGMASFNDIKKRLLHYKKNGVKMPEAFVKKYKQFQKVQERLAATKFEYDAKEDQHELLLNRTSSFQDNIFDARIINRSRWVGYNELKFRLVDPPIEVTYNPEEGSMDKVFALVEVSEGEYEIKVVKE